MMDPSAMAVMAAFYNTIDVFLLIFVRVMGFFIYLPVLSSMNIPTQARVTAALCLSVVIYSSGMVTMGAYYNSTVGYFMLIVGEFLVGVFLGYILFFIFNSVLYAGQIIDYKIGFAMVNVLDPMTQIQVPIAGNLLYLMVSALLAVTGGVHSFVYAFFTIYEIVPIGAGVVAGNPLLAYHALQLLTAFLVMGVKIALPIMAAMMVIDATLGILVKAVPQMNVFVVGMPLKVIIGVILLMMALIPSMGFVFNNLFDTAIKELMLTARRMVP